MERLVAACLQTAIQGEATRGTGGVVFVEGTDLAYLTPAEMIRFPEAFFDRLGDMMEQDTRHFFVVHKDGLNLHVSKIPKHAPDAPRQVQLSLEGPGAPGMPGAPDRPGAPRQIRSSSSDVAL
jgi:hypothetical protein